MTTSETNRSLHVAPHSDVEDDFHVCCDCMYNSSPSLMQH